MACRGGRGLRHYHFTGRLRVFQRDLVDLVVSEHIRSHLDALVFFGLGITHALAGVGADGFQVHLLLLLQGLLRGVQLATALALEIYGRILPEAEPVHVLVVGDAANVMLQLFVAGNVVLLHLDRDLAGGRRLRHDVLGSFWLWGLEALLRLFLYL